MAEYAHPQRGPSSTQYAAQPAPNVEWYSSSSQQQYASSNYAYEQHNYASSSGAAYGTFEDEAPLLEGRLEALLCPFPPTSNFPTPAHRSLLPRLHSCHPTNKHAELGIDIPAIISRTKSILTFRLSGRDVDSLDLGGPLVYMAILGIAHLLVGKLHFGYILGWTVVGSILIWFVLSSIAGHEPEGRTLDLYTCCCLIGYSLLPLVFHAVGSLLLPRRSIVALILGVTAVVWSSQTAARLFIYRSTALRGQLPIVLYPCLLLYTAFALLTLY